MSNQIKGLEILRVTNANYHKYEDMIAWRIDGIELKSDALHKDGMHRKEVLEDENFYVFAAEHKNRFIGWIHILITPKLGKWKKGHLFVDEMWVAPEYRRRGVALALLGYIERVQEETGIERVRLITDTEAARRLYEKYGFKTVNECVFMEK